jgi:sec-independent protein translocase protein TatC
MSVVLALVFGALITPTFDPINQLLVAGPLYVLFELSILLARLVQKRQPREIAEMPAVYSHN